GGVHREPQRHLGIPDDGGGRLAGREFGGGVGRVGGGGGTDRLEELQPGGPGRRVVQGEAEVVDPQVVAQRRRQVAQQRHRVGVDDDRVRDGDQDGRPVGRRGGDDPGRGVRFHTAAGAGG